MYLFGIGSEGSQHGNATVVLFWVDDAEYSTYNCISSNMQFQPFQATAVGQFFGHLQWVGFLKCTKSNLLRTELGLISPNELAETMQVTSSMFLACTNLGVTDRELGPSLQLEDLDFIAKDFSMIDMELNM